MVIQSKVNKKQNQNRLIVIPIATFVAQKTQIKSTIELPEDYQHFENYPVGKAKSFITSNQFSLMHITFKAILEQYNI